ncbi:glucose-6-phosphate dehydrogenase assembly protein OpcA [Chlamydiota bacterium]
MVDPIQLTDLNDELIRLWNTEQGQKKTRASLFNLILYVQKTKRAGFYQELIKSVISKFPCRVMLILSDDSPEEEYLRTKVSSHTLGEGDQQVYCEIIQIEVAGKLSERVPFIIIPQILPDLPVYLLWTQDPATESTVLPHLEPFADRIIFDAESTPDLQQYCKSVLSLMRRFHCAIGDLNWSAISGWRTIFTQVFNDPGSVLSLAQSKIIRIHYNHHACQYLKHTDIEAAYLQAWLASRMSWKFEAAEINEGNTRITYRRPLQDVVFLLVPQVVVTLPPGAILSVEIESVKEQGHYSFKRDPKTRQLFIQYSEKDLCNLPYCSYLSGNAPGQEIVEEIFYPSGGKHYRDMLETLALISWRK